MIREFNPKVDRPAVLHLIQELQDSERNFDTRLPPGSEIAATYIDWMLQRCRKYQGKIFVSEDGSRAVGFVTVLARMKYTDPDAYPHEYALVSELVVDAPFRGRGLGRALLSRAEEYAWYMEASSLQLEVTAGNLMARRLYASRGFIESWLGLEKELGYPP